MKKYLAIFKINLLNNLAYPAELVTRCLMIVLFMWIFFQLWRITFAASAVEDLEAIRAWYAQQHVAEVGERLLRVVRVWRTERRLTLP